MPYACSKAAVYALTQALARNLGPLGVNVNSIAPGFTATEAGLGQDGNEAAFQATINAQCLKRREEPVDLVGTAVFLTSAARATTGPSASKFPAANSTTALNAWWAQSPPSITPKSVSRILPE